MTTEPPGIVAERCFPGTDDPIRKARIMNAAYPKTTEAIGPPTNQRIDLAAYVMMKPYGQNCEVLGIRWENVLDQATTSARRC